MKVSELYAPHGPFNGQEIYVVGTGPSMNVFDRRVLLGKTCLLLNDAQRYFSELGPLAFSNSVRFLEGCELPYQIVKGRLKFEEGADRDDNHCAWDSSRYHVFSYRERPWDSVSHHDMSRLWQEPNHYCAVPGGSVSHFALQFAALCGASRIYLVGCDCTPLEHQDYVNGKKFRDRKRDYNAYAQGLETIVRSVWERFGISVYTLSPFPGLTRESEQYGRMREWKLQTTTP
jgi:hypothetical protein